MLWVAKGIDLTSALTLTKGHCQLVSDCSSTQEAWEKRQKIRSFNQAKVPNLYHLKNFSIEKLCKCYGT